MSWGGKSLGTLFVTEPLLVFGFVCGCDRLLTHFFRAEIRASFFFRGKGGEFVVICCTFETTPRLLFGEQKEKENKLRKRA